MWVLDARKDAEKVWYQVVWGEVKESSNVIDYNINEEITIDNTSVNNANNQTTTGMATLVYWVNAPRLLENTSIYNNTAVKSCSATLDFTQNLYRPDDNVGRVRKPTITKNYWNLDFVIRDDAEISVNWVVIPVSWWYQLDITWARWAWSTWKTSTWIETAQWYRWDIVVAEHLNQDAGIVSQTIKYYFEKWTAVYVKNEFISTLSTFAYTVTTTIVITLL